MGVRRCCCAAASTENRLRGSAALPASWEAALARSPSSWFMKRGRGFEVPRSGAVLDVRTRVCVPPEFLIEWPPQHGTLYSAARHRRATRTGRRERRRRASAHARRRAENAADCPGDESAGVFLRSDSHEPLGPSRTDRRNRRERFAAPEARQDSPRTLRRTEDERSRRSSARGSNLFRESSRRRSRTGLEQPDCPVGHRGSEHVDDAEEGRPREADCHHASAQPVRRAGVVSASRSIGSNPIGCAPAIARWSGLGGVSRIYSVSKASARALACHGRRPRRPQRCHRNNHRSVTVWRHPSDRRGAGRNTRGRVCSPISTAWLSGPFHKYAHVRGKGFFGQTRRERRAYPEVDL